MKIITIVKCYSEVKLIIITTKQMLKISAPPQTQYQQPSHRSFKKNCGGGGLPRGGGGLPVPPPPQSKP